MSPYHKLTRFKKIMHGTIILENFSIPHIYNILGPTKQHWRQVFGIFSFLGTAKLRYRSFSLNISFLSTIIFKKGSILSDGIEEKRSMILLNARCF